MKYIVSWSGGKDCSLAIYKAKEQYGFPTLLLTSVPKEKNSVMAHGYRESILNLQAKAMNLPIEYMYFEPKEYRETYIDKLNQLKQAHAITHVVYGDLYLSEHRVWIEEVCKEVDLIPLFPVWIKPEESFNLFDEYLQLGFKAIMVNVNKKYFQKEWLGKELNVELAAYAKDKFCPMAECGEYHSLVIDGPLFKKGLKIEQYQLVEEEDCYKMKIEKIK